MENIVKKNVAKKDHKISSRKIIFGIVFVLFTIYTITLIYPFIWAFLNSLRDPTAYENNPFAFPERFSFANYVSAYKQMRVHDVSFFGMFFNSVFLTALTTFLAVMGSTCVAYVIAKYKFKGNSFIYAMAAFIMIIPLFGSMPAMYELVVRVLKMDNSIIACALMQGGCFGMYFFMMYGVFQSLSWTYAEAGFIDGANDFTVFFKLMLPQVTPPLFALSLVCAIGIWNDYMYPLLFLPMKPTLSTGLYIYQNKQLESRDRNIPMFFAGTLVVCLPMLIMFVAFQNIIMSNTSVGGIKG